jgi:hypothetical protein
LSKNYFNYHNSTLFFVFEYEFKKLYNSKLPQKNRSSTALNSLTNTSYYTNFLEESLKTITPSYDFKTFNSFFFKSFNKNIKTLNFSNSTLEITDTSNIIIDKDLNKNEQVFVESNSNIFNNF